MFSDQSSERRRSVSLLLLLYACIRMADFFLITRRMDAVKWEWQAEGAKDEKKKNLPRPKPVKFFLSHILALENVAGLVHRLRVHEGGILDFGADGLFFLANRAVIHGVCARYHVS